MPNTLAVNPVKVKMNICRNGAGNGWLVSPELMALPQPKVAAAKNIIFVLDVSDSMSTCLSAVKEATKNLLDQLAPADTYSIVSFNEAAELIVEHQKSTPENIALSKKKVEGMRAGGGTSFFAAFSEVAKKKLIKNIANTTIIFLTDGQDNTHSADTLVKQVSNGKQSPRIVPIGILSARSALLDSLARSAKSIYINSSTPNAYLNAFQEAFDLSLEKSKNPAQIEFTIEAKDSTRSTYKRKLAELKYDGKDSQKYTFNFDSPEAPTSCEIRFSCDDVSLKAKHTLTEQERQQLTNGGYLAIPIPQLLCKDNRTLSWLKTFGLIVLGLLLLGAAAYSVAFPPANFAVPLMASEGLGLLGCALSLYGLTEIISKTIWLPTKMAESDQQAPPPGAGASAAPSRSAAPARPGITAAPSQTAGTPTCLSRFWGRLGYEQVKPGGGVVANKPGSGLRWTR